MTRKGLLAADYCPPRIR